MKLGLFGINMGARAVPEELLLSAARSAEQAGFDSLWAGEHVVLPDPQVPPSPMGPREPSLDPLVALAYAAAATSTIRLATGVIVLPQRNPLVLAKELASVDVLSGGRTILGVGVGYLESEFRAVGADFARRGRRTDEYLDAMYHLWYDDKPEHHGEFVDFGGVDAHPRPSQRPIPLVIAGHTSAAFRRAVSRGNGWYGFAMTPEMAATSLAGLRKTATEVDRPHHLGELEITISPRAGLTAAMAEEFAEIGVHRLAVIPRPTADGAVRAIERASAAIAAL